MDVDKNGEKRKQSPCRNPPHVKRRNGGEKGFVQVQKSREIVRDDDDCCIL
jgi:hypothetical protein